MSTQLDQCENVDEAEKAIDQAIKDFIPESVSPYEAQKEARNQSIMYVVTKVNDPIKAELARQAYGRVLSKNKSARPNVIKENHELNNALDREGMLRFLKDVIAARDTTDTEKKEEYIMIFYVSER